MGCPPFTRKKKKKKKLILIFNIRWNMSGMPMDDGLAVEKYAKSMIELQKKNPVVYKEV